MKTLITAIALSTIGGISMASSFNSVDHAERFVVAAEEAIQVWEDCMDQYGSHRVCNTNGKVLGHRIGTRVMVGDNGKSIPATLAEAKIYIVETKAAEQAAAAEAQAELLAATNSEIQTLVANYNKSYTMFNSDVMAVYMDYQNGGTSAEDTKEIIASFAAIASTM